jgi:peroxiredoxin Q/BCP
MDTPEVHQRFSAGHGLGFPLVSDTDASICKAYGVARLSGWLPPKRVTFVIDRDGIVRNVITGELSADTHVDGALAALRELR